jgi:hypothetical protein
MSAACASYNAHSSIGDDMHCFLIFPLFLTCHNSMNALDICYSFLNFHFVICHRYLIFCTHDQRISRNYVDYCHVMILIVDSSLTLNDEAYMVFYAELNYSITVVFYTFF